MTTNLGTLDRALRVLLGVFLLIIPFYSGFSVFESNVSTVVSIVVGIVLIATSAMRFCPIYRMFGIHTCKL